MNKSLKYKQIGEDLWKTRGDKTNLELFTMTYGAVVAQILKDVEDYALVNKTLEKMGYNMGVRMIEDLVAKTVISTCGDLRETAEIITKVGFKMYMGIVPNVVGWTADNKEFSIVFDENPLAEFVELPEGANLWYSNIYCGIIRGALESVLMQVECFFVSDVLRGDETTEMKVKFIKLLNEEVPASDE